MQFRNAILFHALVLVAQPLYFWLRWTFNRQYFGSASILWLTFALISWFYIITKFTIPVMRSPLRHLPSPTREVFPLGHFWLMRTQPPPTNIVKAAADTKNDGVIAFWDPFYFRSRLILTTPEAVMEVINTHSYDWEKPSGGKKILSRILGNGLINVEGNTHKAMRKTVASAFTGRQIRDLVPLFWSKGLALVDTMSKVAREESNGEVEIMGMMSRVTLDVIGAAGIGTDLNTIQGGDSKLAKLYATITSTNRGPMLLFFLINWLLPPWLVSKMHGTVYARVANAIHELRLSAHVLIEEKRKDMKHNSNGHTDIIATIMRSGDFSDEYLYDQLLTFFAAGHETTASALTWTTWFLSINVDVQERLRKECQQHLSNVQAEEVTADLLDEMPYLTAVCNETLRLYPTVPVTARTAVVDTRIGNLLIPKGTHAIIVPWMTNRDTKLWGEDAETFNPDRWLEGPFAASGGANTPYSFLTFLYGPRSCIGQSFARTEMKCLLAALVLRFRFAPSSNGQEVKIGGFITIKPKGGLRLKVYDLAAAE